MIVAVGIDAVELARMRAALDRTPRMKERAFTEDERAYCDAPARRGRERTGRVTIERYAARFAAKEAVLKVLDESILRVPLRDIEVVRADSGAPSVRLHGRAAARAAERGITGWRLSLTHTDVTASAVAIGLHDETHPVALSSAAAGDAAFYASLDRKRNAAAALLFDGEGRVLVVRPTYEDGWTLPGGAVDAGESPRQACEREILEEVGLRRRVGRLLAVEWRRGDAVRGEAVLWVFDGGTLAADEVAAVALPPDELSAHTFLAPDALAAHVGTRAKARRIRAALDARSAGTTAWLDHGHLAGSDPGRA